MRTMRGGPAFAGAAVLLILLRVTLRLARQGSHYGGIIVIVNVALLAVLVVYAVSQNGRSR